MVDTVLTLLKIEAGAVVVGKRVLFMRICLDGWQIWARIHVHLVALAVRFLAGSVGEGIFLGGVAGVEIIAILDVPYGLDWGPGGDRSIVPVLLSILPRCRGCVGLVIPLEDVLFKLWLGEGLLVGLAVIIVVAGGVKAVALVDNSVLVEFDTAGFL